MRWTQSKGVRLARTSDILAYEIRYIGVWYFVTRISGPRGARTRKSIAACQRVELARLIAGDDHALLTRLPSTPPAAAP